MAGIYPLSRIQQLDKDTGIAYYKFTITGKVAY